jgi:hypothetical protein
MAELFRTVRAELRFVPVVTASITTAVLVTAWRFGVLGGALPAEVGFRYGFTARAPVTGAWSRVVSSELLTRDTFMAVSIVLSLVLMLGLYEAVAGAARAAAVALAGTLAGPLVVAAGLGLGSALGSSFAARTLSTLDYGASTITAAGGGALVAVLAHRRLQWAAAAFVLGGLIVHHQLADWEHLVAFPVGFGMGQWMKTPSLLAPTPPRVGVRRRWPLTGARALGVGAIAAGMAASPALIPAASATASPAVAGRSAAQRSRPLTPPRLIDASFPAPSIGSRPRVMVVLPAGYEQTATRYPVVEVLHGSPGRPDDLFVGGDLLGGLSTSRAAPFITVVPDGHGPVVADGDFADTSRQRLGTAMSDDLRRWVDATYRTNGVWGVAGVSAGGFGAAYLGARPPFAYRAVCAIGGYFEARSPAFSREPAVVRQQDSPLLHVRSSGPATLLMVPAGDPPSAREAARYQHALSLVGQPVTVRQVSGAHDYDAFRRALPQCLNFAATGDASLQQGVSQFQMPYTVISPRGAQSGPNHARQGRSTWKDTHA